MFCRSLVVLLYFFFWPLFCLFFDIRILITSLVSSNSHYSDVQHVLTIWVTRRRCLIQTWSSYSSLEPEFPQLLVRFGFIIFLVFCVVFCSVCLFVFVLCIVSNVSSLSFIIQSWLSLRFSLTFIIYTVKLILRGQHWDKEKVVFYDRWPFKRGSIHMKCSMTGQEKGDILNTDDHLIEMTA
jgi:hypothetical protein